MKTRESTKRWQKKNPLRVRWSVCKGNGKSRGIAFFLTWDDYHRLVTSLCQYCGRVRGAKKTTTHNGIDRKDSGGVYVNDNVVTCCSDCNRRKGTKPYEVFCTISGMCENGGGI